MPGTVVVLLSTRSPALPFRNQRIDVPPALSKVLVGHPPLGRPVDHSTCRFSMLLILRSRLFHCEPVHLNAQPRQNLSRFNSGYASLSTGQVSYLDLTRRRSLFERLIDLHFRSRPDVAESIHQNSWSPLVNDGF